VAATAWKGYISFGLVSIPVRLYPAARKQATRLHQIHRKCHTRIRQPLFCPTCDRIVDRSEVIKGYESEKDQYVLLEEEEIRNIAPPSERTMNIQEFVKLSEVDPIYFHDSYLAVPEEAGRKAYELLLKTLEDSGRAAIAKVSMHRREYLLIMRPRENGLTLHTMYYAAEIRSVSEYGKPDHVQLKAQELRLAKQLVDELSAHFQPKKYHDEYQERLRALIESKQNGETITAARRPKPAPVVDMMQALKKSLAARQPAAGKHAGRAQETATERKTRKRAS
jgi:DNA end-binding protein Ku